MKRELPAVLPWAAGAAALALGGWLAWRLYDTLFPILLGFALAYAFGPVADWLERRRVDRGLSALIIMTVVLGSLGLGLALAIPWLLREAVQFAQDFPRYASVALDFASERLARFGLSLPQTKEILLERLEAWLSGISVASLSPVGRFAGRFFSGAAGTLAGILNLMVVPFIFFYFLRDMPKIRATALSLAPPGWRRAAAARLDEADAVFSGYIRGQLTVALALAAIYGLGLSLAGIPFGILVGTLAGALSLIPYLGPAVGLGLSLVMATVVFSGWWTFAKVLLVFGVGQALESFYITPRLVGNRVGLLPVETVVALILGGELGGLAGLLLAIPVAGCLKAYLKDAAQAWKGSRLFRSA